ncbi:PTS system glucitol/sorbitol-specific transporter subunit IIBC [Streptococcus varani]|uniref:PTS system glucitol/sorbitol-specific transporter subunit IIBC n=1 Tax=Streptococcus varani TaxID=1608583 RepID=A0A0E4H6G2_9STRE|nr:PTS glucitol/sorbitol transporter subunit IIB [Streptococcus varani]CQR23747.1 PTS system glucitol/sorbitol-specific transporter subunit IIBC [Streptococcus varani]
MSEFKAVFVKRGDNGWGDGLLVHPTASKNKIVSVTGGGIHPVAQRVAELTGAQAVDGFKNAVPDEEIAAAVINCGGTARIGVYPMKGILTLDVLPSSPSGPLSKHINANNFVSGVKPECVELQQEGASPESSLQGSEMENKTAFQERYAEVKAEHKANQEASDSFLVRFSRGIGNIMGIFYQSGRDTVDMLIKNIIPFMAFMSTIIGIINYTGVGNMIANLLEPLSGSIVGFIIIAFICSIPFISPVIGPGAVIAQVIGVLIGTQIAQGTIPVTYALPALFAINAQVGCDFIPVGLSLGEAKPETVSVGVPAILYSRVITGTLAVVIGWVFSIGMY